MLSKSQFELYLDEMNKGRETLLSYDKGFVYATIFFALLAIGGIAHLICGLIGAEFFSNMSLETLGPILTQDKTLFYIGIGGFGLVVVACICVELHKFMRKRKMKSYLENHHGLIVSKHKKIFRDHSKESIKAFTEERVRKVLLETLENQIRNITFVVNNYENISGEAVDNNEDDYEDPIVEDIQDDIEETVKEPKPKKKQRKQSPKPPEEQEFTIDDL